MPVLLSSLLCFSCFSFFSTPFQKKKKKKNIIPLRWYENVMKRGWRCGSHNVGMDVTHIFFYSKFIFFFLLLFRLFLIFLFIYRIYYYYNIFKNTLYMFIYYYYNVINHVRKVKRSFLFLVILYVLIVFLF